MYSATVIPLWHSSFFLLTSFVMCLPPLRVACRSLTSTSPSYMQRWNQLALAEQCQSDERTLPGEGTGEDKQDSVSLPSQVLLPSFQDPVLVNLHLESNAFCANPPWHNQYWRSEMQYKSKYLSQGSENILISVLWDFGGFLLNYLRSKGKGCLKLNFDTWIFAEQVDFP